MYRVRLIHWNDREVEERVEKLRGAGFHAEYEPASPTTLKLIRADPPHAIVIDLGRLPSQGREIAIALRNSKKTRHVPIVFVDGLPEKVFKTKASLPDASYCTWTGIRQAVEQAIATPPASPVVPADQMGRGARSPLVKKLDIKPGTVLVVINSPDHFLDALVDLPPGVTLRIGNRGRRDLTIWFVDRQVRFFERLDAIIDKIDAGSIWIAYPKKSSGRSTDVTQKLIRETCRDRNLVDYKVCAIDETWTGMKFTCRKG